MLSDMPFLFFVQAAAEHQQFFEQVVNVATPRIVGLDQFFEFLQIVGPGPVQTDELVKLRTDRRLELLQVDILGLGPPKSLGQGLEVDLDEIDHRVAERILGNMKPIGGDRGI